MVSFTSESTIHGISHIFGPNRSIFQRIFWTLLMILSFFGMIYYIKTSYTKWLISPDIITKTITRDLNQFPYPAITICPRIFLNDTLFTTCHISSVWCKMNTNEINTSENCNLFKYETLFNDLIKISPVIGPYFLKEAPKKHNQFREILTVYGLCYTFNMYSRDIFDEEIIEDNHGFLNSKDPLMEWTNDDEYLVPNSSRPLNLVHIFGDDKLKSSLILYFFSLKSAIQGINHCNNSKTYYVIFHPPNEFPTIFHEKHEFVYTVGYSLNLKLKSYRSSEHLRLIDPDIRKCYFDNERKLKYFKKYTKNHCELECMYEGYRECRSVELPRVKNDSSGLQICNSSSLWQKDFSKQPNDMVKKKISCKCYETCNYLKYDTSIHYFHQLKPSEMTHFMNAFSLTYPDNFVEEIQKLSTFTLSNFIAEIGGYLGFFLGCSILSVMEIFFFLVIKTFASIKRIFKFNNLINTEIKNSQQDELKKELQIIRTELQVEFESKFNKIREDFKLRSISPGKAFELTGENKDLNSDENVIDECILEISDCEN